MDMNEELPSIPVYSEPVHDFSQRIVEKPMQQTLPMFRPEPDTSEMDRLITEINRSRVKPKEEIKKIEEVKEKPNEDRVMKILHNFIKPEEKKKTTASELKLGLLVAIIGLSSAFFVKYLFDTTSNPSGPPLLGMLISIMFAILFVIFFANQIRKSHP